MRTSRIGRFVSRAAAVAALGAAALSVAGVSAGAADSFDDGVVTQDYNWTGDPDQNTGPVLQALGANDDYNWT